MENKNIIEIGCREDLINYCNQNNIIFTLFNQPVKIKEGIEDCSGMFSGLTSFNQEVIIPKGVTICSKMFMNCVSFNSKVIIPDSVTDCDKMFMNCKNFNKPIKIPANLMNGEGMFRNCHNLNNPISFKKFKHVSIPKVNNYPSAYDQYIYTEVCLQEMFENCYSFNQEVEISVHIEDYIILNGMFRNCHELNSQIFIENITSNKRLICTDNMFENCYKFNKPIVLPTGLRRSTEMFKNCYSFNQEIKISSNIKHMERMFENCYSLNSTIDLPDKYDVFCNGLLKNCYSFNSIITNINKGDIYEAFLNCKSLEKLINFDPNNLEQYDLTQMFAGCVKLKFDQELDLLKLIDYYSSKRKINKLFAGVDINIGFDIGFYDYIGSFGKIIKVLASISKFSNDQFLNNINIQLNGKIMKYSSIKGIRIPVNYTFKGYYNDAKNLLVIESPVNEKIIAKALVNNLN